MVQKGNGMWFEVSYNTKTFYHKISNAWNPGSTPHYFNVHPSDAIIEEYAEVISGLITVDVWCVIAKTFEEK